LRFRYNFTAEIAAKTGTTNNNSDGWFMGVTPKIVGGVWVGAEDRSVHFDNTSMGSGTNMALPVWAEFMQRVYADSTLGIFETDKFEKPAEINFSLDCDSVMNYKDPEFEEEFDIPAVTFGSE
jgi:penicillin-binding protein 1A